MFKSALFPEASILSRLQLLVKDQKPRGKAVTCPMHAPHHYMFSGLSSWLAQILQAKLQEMAPWLLKDFKDLMDRIRNIPRPANDPCRLPLTDLTSLPGPKCQRSAPAKSEMQVNTHRTYCYTDIY